MTMDWLGWFAGFLCGIAAGWVIGAAVNGARLI
jgi:hypothetical protein